MKLGKQIADKIAPPKSLTEQIEEVRAQVNAIIDERAAKIARDCPGVPVGVIRNQMTRSGCDCRDYLRLEENGIA